MKNKLWIKSRIFITFFCFTIFIVNTFAYVLYLLIWENFIKNTIKDLNLQYNVITNLIDENKSNNTIFSNLKLDNITNSGFFYFIWINDNNIISNYKIWLSYYKENKIIAYRWDYLWYNIVIWKDINDLNKIKDKYIDFVLIINIFLIIFVFFVTYFLSTNILKPLFEISDFIKKYDLNKPKQLIKNEYWNSEIWKYIDSTNSFLNKINNIFTSQKDFIQDASHELKTPLMQIQSSLELLEDKIKDEKMQNKIQNIKWATDNINNIISKLSFLLRDNESIKREKISMWDYFQNKTSEIQELANSKNIKININLQKDFTIESNIYYIDRLFDNILSNAIFYNNWNNNIFINIYEFYIEVIDEWIWIEKDKLSKIFNRFYRDDISKMYYENGSGLGLSIVDKICKMFWWKLNFESKLWVGTKVKIEFR